MPIIDFPTINYEDFGDDPKRAIDKLNDIHRQLEWLLRHLDKANIEHEAIAPAIEPEEDKPTVVDSHGINDEYLDYYPNKAYNASFEVFDTTTLKPDYWDTSGVVSPDANFDSTYSLKLTPGQYAEQKEDEQHRGLCDPAWWSWLGGRTRIAFRVKGIGGGKVRATVWQSGSVVQLAHWTTNDKGEEVEVMTEPPHRLEFDVLEDWPGSRHTFAALPLVGGGKIKLRFDNVGSTDIYIDAVLIRADWTGKWPGLYKPGQMANIYVNARKGARNVWVQSTAPEAFEIGDLWVDTSE